MKAKNSLKQDFWQEALPLTITALPALNNKNARYPLYYIAGSRIIFP